ncbi:MULTISPECIES: YybS family protein [Bacillus]|uniref:YybS family protein n=1 Tax=Bacillus TaxID=1386 RepID=UPI00098B60B1|nr:MULTISPECIES: YybS family protein [Bacillus]WFA05302.1 YybS family protein [Bacillus sp. HSf4]
MKQTRALVEGAILLSLFAVLMMISLYIPLIGTFLLFALPLPVMMLTIRHGVKPGLFMGLVSLPVSMVAGSLSGLILAFPVSAAGIMMGFHYRKKEPGYAITSAAVTYMVSMVLLLFVSIQFFGLNLIETANQTYNETFNMFESSLKQFGNDKETVKQMEQMKEQLQQMRYLYPTMIVMFSGIAAFLNHLIAKPILRRTAVKMPSLKPFRELRLPQSIIWVYLLTILLSLAPAEEGSVFYSILLNASMLLGFIMAIQGFSFVFYFCHAKKMPTVLPVIFLIIALFSPLVYLVRILGIMDIGFNLREKIKKK